MAKEGKKIQAGKSIPLYGRIFIALGIGIAFGYVLNMMGGTHNPVINGYILPFLQFLGNFFIKLIKMVVVPLVFFCIVDAALSLGDINKLKSVGVTTIIWFLVTGMISAMIGLFWVNLIQPGKGLQLGTVTGGVKAKELPGMYQTILDFIPTNPFESLTTGSMMQIIVFSLFIGFAIISLGKKAEPLGKIFSMLSMVMFKIVDYVIAIIPVGVFGLMSTTMTKYGTAIFGPVLKFILTDYLACLTTTFGVYTLLLAFVARVNVITFWKKAFSTWLVAFSTCTSSAALPVSMDIAPNKMGAPKDISSFILPLGCTAQMNGTCAYFAVVILFAAQLYGVELSLPQQILLCVQATFLSVGCAATPQIGLVISLTLMTQMGLPLDGYSLVAGIYRIVDQIHTATNSVGDLVATVCISNMQHELDHQKFDDLSLISQEDEAV